MFKLKKPNLFIIYFFITITTQSKIIEFFSSSLLAQQEVVTHKEEIGLSLDVLAPFPGTSWDKNLTANLGLGFYYKSNFSLLVPELGFFWSYLPSNESQKLVLFPVYLALGFKLPIESRLDVIPKIGIGEAKLDVQPVNISGWSPLLFTGLELSILASRWFRIGVRMDYLYIYDSLLSVPKDVANPKPIPSYVDDRFKTPVEFKKADGQFLRFGILFGFLF